MDVNKWYILYMTVLIASFIGLLSTPQESLAAILIQGALAVLVVAMYLDKEYRGKYVPHITDKIALVILCVVIVLLIVQILIHFLHYA